MKRSILLLGAVALAVFGVLVAVNVIEFETDRIDRWVPIFAAAGVAVLIGLLSADSVAADPDEAATGRAAAARQLQQGRIDPADLPSKPGSLLRQKPIEDDDSDVDSDVEVSADAAFDETEPTELVPVSVLDAPSDAMGHDAMGHDAMGHAEDLDEEVVIDPVEAELQELIDVDQMHEITALVSAAESDPDPIEHLDLVAGTESAEPLARLELRLADYDDDDLKRVVKESEAVVIAEMVRTGQLTSEGELTEKDIASMVFLAYTSDEMLAELRLRKSLDHPGLEASTGNDFAPLKNIE